MRPFDVVDWALFAALIVCCVLSLREWWVERNQPDVWQKRQSRKRLNKSQDKFLATRVGQNLLKLGIVEKRTAKFENGEEEVVIGITSPARTVPDKIRRWFS